MTPRVLAVGDREYTVQKLLGKGKGGYSYLVRDGAGEYVLKQIHHEPCEYYQFGDKMGAELRDYRRLREIGIPLPALLGYDLGRERLLKQYIDGPTIYSLVLAGGMREGYVAQLRAMCQKLYAAGLNIDYFPTNFLVQNGQLYYVDYECNAYMQEWDFEHWGCRYWSKTPELLRYARAHGPIPGTGAQ